MTARHPDDAPVIGLDLGGTKTAAALVATARPRPDGSTFGELVEAVHAAGAPVMADVSTFDEGREAAGRGADLVVTTLSGYVPGSSARTAPDLALAAAVPVPVIAEGRVATPEQAAEALAAGAHGVVAGTAVTAPTALTRAFAAGLRP
jgi:N-acylglucosamine-6-phosphate 2-epimerase